MALIKDQTTRLLHPTEKDADGKPAWFDVRPLRTGDIEQLGALGLEVKVTVEALAAVIVAWSYDEPVTIENVRLLDLDTFLWLGQQALLTSGIRKDAEKNASGSGLSPLRPPAEDSPPSSSISATSDGSGTPAS